MGGLSRDGSQSAAKIDGQVSTETDRFVRITRINGQRISFRDLAKFAWPQKTESFLAHVAQVDVRTARRWLADDTGPPADALGAVIAEIMRRFHQRQD